MGEEGAIRKGKGAGIRVKGAIRYLKRKPAEIEVRASRKGNREAEEREEIFTNKNSAGANSN